MGEPTAKILEGRTAVPTRPSGSDEAAGAVREDRQPEQPRALAARLRRLRRSWRFRQPRAPRLWSEVVLIGMSYWIYSLVRNAVPEQQASATLHAMRIWRIESSLGIAVEEHVNHAVNSVTWLIIGMNYYYATLHFVVTTGVLVWIYHSHPGRYASARLTLFATTVIALVGFYFFPLTPPRLTPSLGFIDTVTVHHTWGSLASGNLSHVSNQYAAMPSMHIGWALWCGLAIAMFARRRWVKVLGMLYPLATLLVIISTANHFWLDAVAGVVTLAFGSAVSYVVYGRLTHRLPRYAALPAPAQVPQIAAPEPVIVRQRRP